MKKLFLKSKVNKSEFSEFHEACNTNRNLVNSFNLYELSITGESLIREGFKPGPKIGKEIEERELILFSKILKI